MDKPNEDGALERRSARREFLDIEEVSAEIRERVRKKSNREERQASAGIFSQPIMHSTSQAPHPTLWLTGAEKLWRNILVKESLIGSMPGSPPTLRGRIGRALIQLVQRSLFWLIPQIQRFQQEVAIATKEQVTALQDLTERVSRFDTVSGELTAQLTEQEASLTALRQAKTEAERTIEDELASLRALLEQRAQELAGEIAARENLEVRTNAIVGVPQDVGQRAVLEPWVSRIMQLERYSRLTRSELLQLQRQFATSSPAHPTGGSATDPQTRESSYLEFQDAFRGSYEDIKNRFSVHLGRLRPEQHGRPDAPLVDVGCGRGEWLTLLREQNLVAYGVDSNSAMVNLCSQDGLVAQQDDLLEHICNLPANSRGGVTAFHVIEHLPPAALEDFLDGVLRVLVPGGILILETPNPANVFVGSRTFYLDPTHQNPLPSELVRFLLDSRGFTGIEIIPLHPYPESAKLNMPGNRAAEFIDEHFFGAQDYAVVCSKPN
jgi:SAM-dependent methyltransferase